MNSQFHFLIAVEPVSAMITLKMLHFAQCMYVCVYRAVRTNYRSQTIKNTCGILVAMCTTYRRVTGKIDLQLRIPSPVGLLNLSVTRTEFNLILRIYFVYYSLVYHVLKLFKIVLWWFCIVL